MVREKTYSTSNSNIEEKMRRIAQEIYDENSTVNQYSIAEVAFHKHSGKDSAKVPFTNLSDVPSGFTDQKGRSLIVSDDEKLVTFSGTVLPTDATTGFIMLPTCDGTPTGAPEAETGAIVYDTDTNRIWVYNGSWRGVTLT